MTRIGGRSGPNIPALVIPATPPENMVTVGIPDMTFDGEPFPFATVGGWRLDFDGDAAASITITIPVRIAEPGDVEPDEPAPDPEDVGPSAVAELDRRVRAGLGVDEPPV